MITAGKVPSVLAATLAVLLCCGSGAYAAEVPIRTAGMTAKVKVRTLLDIRYRTIVRQQNDFSCGAAALATLLKFHYDTDITEAELVDAMMRTGDPGRIRSQGFSMGDMQRFLAAHNVKANGYWAKLEETAEAGIPFIVLINVRGYRHFVVVKGIHDGRVLVGDPALGLKIYGLEDLQAIQEGPVFAIDDFVEVGRNSFNRPDEWRFRPKVTEAASVARPGGAQLMNLRLPGEF